MKAVVVVVVYVRVRDVITRSKNTGYSKVLKEPLPQYVGNTMGYRVMKCYCWLCVLF